MQELMLCVANASRLLSAGRTKSICASVFLEFGHEFMQHIFFSNISIQDQSRPEHPGNPSAAWEEDEFSVFNGSLIKTGAALQLRQSAVSLNWEVEAVQTKVALD